jgi:hypothetical protein
MPPLMACWRLFGMDLMIDLAQLRHRNNNVEDAADKDNGQRVLPGKAQRAADRVREKTR